MKAITNQKRKMLAGLVLMLALTVPIVWSPTAAQALVNTHITIPGAVVNDNTTAAQVVIRDGGHDIVGSPFASGVDVGLDSTRQYGWMLLVNNRLGPMHFFTGGQPIAVTAADYCHMKIIIPSDIKNLNGSPGVVTFYDVSGPFENGDYLYFPTGIDVSWYITVNGMRSDHHEKRIDCTDLNVGQFQPPLAASYCKMKIVIPSELQTAGATVRINGIGQTFTGGEIVVLPVGQTITWYLKINGKEAPHTGKYVDCTPINVSSADYCNVVNNTGASISIYGYGNVVAGGSVLFPTGIQIEWKPSTQGAWPGTTKNVDCTPIAP